jgi:hypothetical protein
MVDTHTTSSEAAIPKHFLHEAAHALALYSFGIMPARLTLEVGDDPRDTNGGVLPHPKADLSIAEYVFFKMCGPAAHIYLGDTDFESDRNIFTNDFASVLRYFPSLMAGKESICTTLLACKRFMDDHCRAWVEQHRLNISALAEALQSSPIREGRYLLEGEALKYALDSCGFEDTADIAEHKAQVDQTFQAVWNSMRAFDTRNAPDWVKYYGAYAVSASKA